MSLTIFKTIPHTIIVKISNRLVQSPCAIVAEAGGYTANVQKMMSTFFLPSEKKMQLTKVRSQVHRTQKETEEEFYMNTR